MYHFRSSKPLDRPYWQCRFSVCGHYWGNAVLPLHIYRIRYLEAQERSLRCTAIPLVLFRNSNRHTLGFDTILIRLLKKVRLLVFQISRPK